jgi:DUF1680 family protein
MLRYNRTNETIYSMGVNIISGVVPTKDGQAARKFTAIPYYAWSNRGAGMMKVWLPRN